MTNLSLSQMEQVMDGKVASKLWLQIIFAVRCRQTVVYFSWYDKVRNIPTYLSVQQKSEISYSSCLFFLQSINLHYLSDTPNDLLSQKAFILCLSYYQVSITEDKKMYENRKKRAPACTRSINEMLATLKIAY